MTNETHDVGELRDLVRKLQAQVTDLEKDSDELNALYAAGVNNWDGYDHITQPPNGDTFL